MRTFNRLSSGIVFCFFISTGLYAEKKFQAITLETRGPGDYIDGAKVKPIHSEELFFNSKELEVKTLYDIQYGVKKTYRGIYLMPLIVAKGGDSTLVLLHFENGMIIPIPLSSLNNDLKKINPFLAFEIKGEQSKWEKSFPAIDKKSAKEAFRDDPRPLQFNDNKIVVESSWHPFLHNNNTSFSPWLFSSSLVKIEFASQAGYYAQFEVSKKSNFKKGMKVFFERCQYCHGVRHIGASYGWDYVDPLPTYQQKRPEHLYNHVKFPKWEALQNGLMMPSQKDITEEEAKMLWEWMRFQAELRQKPYKP